MFEKIQELVKRISYGSIRNERKQELEPLIEFIQRKVDDDSPVLLNFICTHNSRRSQFSQVWAQVASEYYQIPIQSYSGGVEVTAFNERAVSTLERSGFEISREGDENPHYLVKWSTESEGLEMFSKLYDDIVNPSEHFAAILTCSDADENCPFVAGCEQRIPIRYNDPKEFDDTEQESEMYDSRSFEIATELFYVFSKVRK